MNYEFNEVTIMSNQLSTYERKMQDKKFKTAYEKHYKELLFSELLISIITAVMVIDGITAVIAVPLFAISNIIVPEEPTSTPL